jgi:large repetitive protein
MMLALLASAACEDEDEVENAPGDAAMLSYGSQDAARSEDAPVTVARDGGQSATGTVTPLARARDVSRQAHAIVQLADGMVLVTGGIKFPSPLSGLVDSALYDLKAGTLTVVGPMQDGRHSHSTTLLADGRVFVAGGYGGTPPAQWRTAELYDPATRTFNRITSQMSVARLRHGAFRLSTGALAGKVIVLGGGALGTQMTVDIYDPATSTFAPVTTIDAPAERQGQAFALLADESVLITGGRTVANAAPTVESYVYVPSTAIFRRVGDALEGRQFPTATRLVDGRVLVVGGQTGANLELATTELYDPAMARFIVGPAMTTPRRNHTAARLGSGRILIAGGNPTSSTTTGLTELFVPGTDTITPGADLATALAVIVSIPLSDGRVFMMGGQAMGGLVSRYAELFSD